MGHRSAWAVLAACAVAAALSLLTAACEEDSVTSDESGIGYRLESEPTLSVDGQYVYMVATDTIHANNSGIYRARVSRPQRELILAGDGYHSPTVSTDNTLLAYLREGTLTYYRFAGGVKWNTNVPGSYSSVLFVDSGRIVAGVGDSIYLLDEAQASRTSLVRGGDPTLVREGAFAYRFPRPGYAYSIAVYDMASATCDTVFTISTLENLGEVRWPTYHESSKRLAWLTHDWWGNTVSTCHADSGGIENHHYIDTTGTLKPYLIGADAVIYTGPDGRFRKSDYRGLYKSVFWYAERN